MDMNNDRGNINEIFFGDSGGKIKCIALIAFWLGVAASVIVPVVFAIKDESAIFLLFIPAGVLTSWLFTIFIYGFGDLIQNTEGINYKTAFIKRNHRYEKTAEADFEDDSECPAQEENSGSWKCPECGQINSNRVNSCKCGASKWSLYRSPGE